MHIILYSPHLTINHIINVTAHESFNIINKDKYSFVVKEIIKIIET
jgi:hypothetical protein